MINTKTPGVYIKEYETAPLLPLRISITGFVGQAERGPLNCPQVIRSWNEFRTIFGGFVGYSYMSYAVFGFFLNGGERCYVVRVAHESAKKAMLDDLADERNVTVMSIEALNQGKWAEHIEVTVEGQSKDDMVLTELADTISEKPDNIALRSVRGLAPGDTITLTHKNKSIRERVTIMAIDYGKGLVTFQSPVNNEFPKGSKVLGKGFKLTFHYQAGDTDMPEEVFDNLSMNKDHERYFVRVINGEDEKDYGKRIRNGNSILIRVKDKDPSGICSRPLGRKEKLKNGDDGTFKLVVGYYTGYDDTAYFRPPGTISGNEEKAFGLAALETINEIGLIAIPDLIIADFYAVFNVHKVPEAGIIFAEIPVNALTFDKLKTGQHDMLMHCEKMGDRFAILDSPRGLLMETGEFQSIPELSAEKIEDWPNNFQQLPSAKYGALYYPWIKGKTSDFEGHDVFVPPCGHVAGIYARTERERGVGKAPANEILQGVVDLEFRVSDKEQDVLNPRGVNCMRFFPGRGLRVWGARTLSLDSRWRYINVRRVCLAIIKNILVNLQWTVFEPNDQRLKDKIISTLTLFFRNLFQGGALAGTTPEEAFFIKCDGETNPPEVVERGEVVTLIGFAPAYPSEFILVTITRNAESLTLSEQMP